VRHRKRKRETGRGKRQTETVRGRERKRETKRRERQRGEKSREEQKGEREREKETKETKFLNKKSFSFGDKASKRNLKCCVGGHIIQNFFCHLKQVL
jgi:hypothetical protein